MRWRDVKQGKIKRKQEVDKTPKINYATNIVKFKAFITDAFLLSMPIIYVVMYLVFGGREGFRDHMLLGWIYFLLPLGIIVALFQSLKGQTPGMKAYDLKIIDLKSESIPTFVQAFWRFLVFNLAFFSLLLLLVGVFRKDKRGIWDILSNTAEIEIDKVES
jgi:uncharacterized RDD family membrane protein YckC